MKAKFTPTVILMVLCAFVLVATIGLYAADVTQSVEAKCDSYCNKHYGDKPKLYAACYDGCIFGASQ